MTTAIQAWHDRLAKPDYGAPSAAMLEEQLRRRNLVFGDRPLCTVLRPRFLTAAQYASMSGRIRRLMRAFTRAHIAAMVDPALRAQFRLEGWEERLVMGDPGYKAPSPHGRLDCFWDLERDVLALTEYNAETPAGAGYHDVLSEAFSVLPVMRRFRMDWDVRPLQARPGVASVLLDAWREYRSFGGLPRVAIVDWDDVPTTSEFEIFREYFATLGIATEIVDPRALEYKFRMLKAPGGQVDLIYKRVLINELIEREGEDTPLVQAVRDGAVCMVNPFRCKLLHKKASLAFLSDERNAALFEPAERAEIAAQVPWTRVVEERKTEYGGRSVDLLQFIADEQQRLVLKPNDDYGGAGVVLGWTATSEDWAATIRKALTAPYIVQEKVVVPSEPYPSWVDGRLQVVDRMLDTAPFVLNGEVVEGALTRLSTAALLNVTAGGGSTVPVMVAERRT